MSTFQLLTRIAIALGIEVPHPASMTDGDFADVIISKIAALQKPDLYKGMTNYETWKMLDMITKTENLNEFYGDLARRASTAQVAAEAIEELVTEDGLMRLDSLPYELAVRAINRVNWIEIAEALREE